MIALLQRVTSAPVSVSGERIAEISHGLLVLIGVEKHNLVLGTVCRSEVEGKRGNH